MISTDRIPCCIPFCRRTAPRERHPNATEIICGKHWRTAAKQKRRVYSRAQRAWCRAAAREIAPGSYANAADLVRAMRAWHRVERLWGAMKTEIIQIAAGIARAS